MRILLSLESDDVASRCRQSLQDMGWTILDESDDSQAADCDVLLTDHPDTVFTTDLAERRPSPLPVIVTVGEVTVDDQIRLPEDVTERELKLVLPLVAEICRLRRGRTDDLEERRRLDTIATTDVLTELPNRRAWDRCLDALPSGGGGWAVALIDLDQFKMVNDELGFSVGDRVLKRVADQLQNGARRGDLVARIGGDEFAVLLRDIRAEDVRGAVERIRIGAASETDDKTDDAGGRVTASAGYAAGDGTTDPRVVLERASMALRAAKGAGRDRTECWVEEFS